MKNVSLDKVLIAIQEYLKESGWEDLGMKPGVPEELSFYWLDPITGLAHRADFAFLLQSEREINERFGTFKKVGAE